MNNVQYLRQTSLHDVYGRINYIRGDTDKQEYLMAYYSTITDEEWKDLAYYNQERFKSNKKGFNKQRKCKAIEARELILHIPHKYAKCDSNELAKNIGDDWKLKFGTDCCLAIHWNKSKTNYHIHLIYCERVRENKVATRNMFYDIDWKRCKKADAIHIIHKGDIVSKWGDKDARFKKKSFMQDVIKPYYASKFGLEEYKDDGLHLKEQKEYKINPTSSLEYIELHDKIVEYNKNVRKWNKMVDIVLSQSYKHEYLQFIDEIMRPAVATHKQYRKQHKDSLPHIIEQVGKALNTLEE